jgi:hypothetical protein
MARWTDRPVPRGWRVLGAGSSDTSTPDGADDGHERRLVARVGIGVRRSARPPSPRVGAASRTS